MTRTHDDSSDRPEALRRSARRSVVALTLSTSICVALFVSGFAGARIPLWVMATILCPAVFASAGAMFWAHHRAERALAQARALNWLLCPRCEYPLDACVGYDPALQSPTPLAPETVTCPECGWGGRAADVVSAWRALDTQTNPLFARR